MFAPTVIKSYQRRWNLLVTNQNKLRTMSKEWSGKIDELGSIVDNMHSVMEKHEGVGISAIQIGVPFRIFLAGHINQPELFINPKIEIAAPTMPPALPFNVTQIIKAELSGLVCYHITLGQIVEEGELIANILLLDGPNAFRKKVPVYAGTSGIIFSMMLQKYIWKGEPLAKIAGSKPLSNRKGVLLEA